MDHQQTDSVPENVDAISALTGNATTEKSRAIPDDTLRVDP